MTATFQKRQKEMKRIEKQKIKEEKRAQRKQNKPPAPEVTYDPAKTTPARWLLGSSNFNAKWTMR